jgi:hypothetical protein
VTRSPKNWSEPRLLSGLFFWDPILIFAHITQHQKRTPEDGSAFIPEGPEPWVNTLRQVLWVVVIGGCALVSQGCAVLQSPRSFEFDVEATRQNQPWYSKIQDWQGRNDPVPKPTVRMSASSLTSTLSELDIPAWLWPNIDKFSNKDQLAQARRIDHWSKHWAIRHYIKDADESVENDPWPIFSELMENGGDDCDGVSLLSFEMLLMLGFNRDEVYRAIVQNDSDGVNHMVVLWFNTKDDPWVLDAARAASPKMKPLSDLKGWNPVAMFNRDHIYNIVEIKP